MISDVSTAVVLMVLIGAIVAYELVLVAVVVNSQRAAQRRAEERARRGRLAVSVSAPLRTADPGLLASDEERDEAAQLIAAALAEWRLDLEEGIRRIELAVAARRCGELQALVADLPDRGQGRRAA